MWMIFCELKSGCLRQEYLRVFHYILQANKKVNKAYIQVLRYKQQQQQQPTKTKTSNLGQNEEHSLWLFTKYYILGLVWWNDSVGKAVDDTADVVAASS